MTPDQMLLLLTGAGAIIGAGGVYLWRKGDDKTDKMREDLIDLASDLNSIGFSISGGFAKKLAAGNIWAAIAEARAGVAIIKDPEKRLQHFGSIAVQNMPTLLKSEQFGPMIRKMVKDQDILIDSKDSSESTPV